jgi:hypothetical protein
LWGVVLVEDEFYSRYGLTNTQKNYLSILKYEVIQKLKEFEERLKSDLLKVNLNLIETKVKPL